jgi:hypothetical protein
MGGGMGLAQWGRDCVGGSKNVVCRIVMPFCGFGVRWIMAYLSLFLYLIGGKLGKSWWEIGSLGGRSGYWIWDSLSFFAKSHVNIAGSWGNFWWILVASSGTRKANCHHGVVLLLVSYWLILETQHAHGMARRVAEEECACMSSLLMLIHQVEEPHL